jgi:hypothetical protein
MHEHSVHVDEVSALTWIAISAFALAVAAAVLSVPTQGTRVASDLHAPAPLAAPTLVPSRGTDPRA